MQEQTRAQLRRLGHAIRSARKERGLSQEDFAETCDLHRTYIGHVERGEANVSYENIARISKALRVRPSALFASAGL